MSTTVKQLRARWARAGVWLNVRADRSTPDPERLLLDTARLASRDARLFTLAVTWVSRYGTCIARHRLRRLAARELEREAQPALGLLLASAVEFGGVGELLIVAQVCRPAETPGPLFDVDRSHPEFAALARRHACRTALRWNLWAPPIEPKFDALRSAAWIWKHNPDYRERFVRRGDLRCTVLEVLRRDVPGGAAPSESDLSRSCGATRAAVRKALDALELEGFSLRSTEPVNRRDTPICLRAAA